MKKVSFINQFKIVFLLPFTGYRKVLRELSHVGIKEFLGT